jgi:hypothetical protein
MLSRMEYGSAKHSTDDYRPAQCPTGLNDAGSMVSSFRIIPTIEHLSLNAWQFTCGQQSLFHDCLGWSLYVMQPLRSPLNPYHRKKDVNLLLRTESLRALGRTVILLGMRGPIFCR